MTTYQETLRTLSEASVTQHFDAFADIDWDHPDYAIDPTDPRWVLPEVDVLGRHPWYQALPLDEQARRGPGPGAQQDRRHRRPPARGCKLGPAPG